MILVILAIGIVILTTGFVLCYSSQNRYSSHIGAWAYQHDWIYILSIVAGAIITVVSISVTIALGYSCSSERAINAKIEMYQQENQHIETVVAEVVKDYQDYEVKAFSELSPQEIMVAISMYPELKSNELVSKQLAIYVSNNNNIKALKIEQIDLITTKWWLYFGQ